MSWSSLSTGLPSSTVLVNPLRQRCWWLLYGLLFGTVALAQSPALMLAHKYQAGVPLDEYWVSEKLDGVRARWNGQQLISRGGRVFAAPAWFTQGFPSVALDGELWLKRGAYEQTVSIVNRQQPHQGWRSLRFMVFDLPLENRSFSDRLMRLQQLLVTTDSIYLALIPQLRVADEAELQAWLAKVIKQRGEGLMLHHQDAVYRAGRSRDLLKLKPFDDAEAEVIGYRPGKGKYQGMVGSLQLRTPQGVIFYAGTGLSDQQRQNPPPIGAWVTYRYQGLTRRDKPRFPVFLHQRLLE